MGMFEEVMELSSRKPGGAMPFLSAKNDVKEEARRASYTGMTSTLWDLELHPINDRADLLEDIAALSKRALDRNLFFEPTVLDAFWPRMKARFSTSKVMLLCLYEHGSKKRQLRLFMPIGVSKVGFPAHPIVQVLANEFLPDGTPIIDAETADEACEVLFQVLCDKKLELPGIINFSLIRSDSKTATAFQNAANRLGLRVASSSNHMRASLTKTPTSLPKKRQKEYARQRRRLMELGTLELDRVKTYPQIIDAFEDHLTLELTGWKGRKGTALYNDRASTGFARQMVSELAQKNACEIFRLQLNGKPIASLVVLGSEARTLTWKIAYNETLSAYSPGVQLMLDITEILQARDDFGIADSLAIASHPMIDRLWHERIPITDWSVAITDTANTNLLKIVSAKNRLERWYGGARFVRKIKQKLGFWTGSA